MEEILHQLICRIYNYLQGFIHLRWLAGLLNHQQYGLFFLLKTWVYSMQPGLEDRQLKRFQLSASWWVALLVMLRSFHGRIQMSQGLNSLYWGWSSNL